MSNERPNLVAPRPVRLSNTFFQRDDLKVSFYADIADIADKPRSPDRPCSAFQTEALEEFLSILRPSFMRKPRSLTTKPRHRLDVADHHNIDSRDLTTPPGMQDIHVEPDARWFSSSLLSSPVSRMHTRNPFLRNSDNRSPATIAPLTPAAIPLPLPTPDELVDNS